MHKGWFGFRKKWPKLLACKSLRARRWPRMLPHRREKRRGPEIRIWSRRPSLLLTRSQCLPALPSLQARLVGVFLSLCLECPLNLLRSLVVSCHRLYRQDRQRATQAQEFPGPERRRDVFPRQGGVRASGPEATGVATTACGIQQRFIRSL